MYPRAIRPVLMLLLGCTMSALAAEQQLEQYAYVTRDYPEPLPLSLLEQPWPDEGLQGARFANKYSNIKAGFLGRRFELREYRLAREQVVTELVSELEADGQTRIVADLNRADLLELADSDEASDWVIINIRSEDESLRLTECRANVFHLVPSRSMRVDSIAQYLVWKKWTRWFLISGKNSADKAYANAVHRAAKRYGAKIVSETSYQLETGSRRVETGHQQIQTQMPMLTRDAKDHDVIFVADESESFGLYLPYRTTLPRPVAGTYGMTATAWHRSFEQYGGMTLQSGFEEFADRIMTERDYLAWLGIKLFAEAILKTDGSNTETLELIRSEDYSLAGHKGRAMNFRNWNQQLRQPILLSGARSLVSMAPVTGFLHPKHYTDTLGYDRNESECRLGGND